MYLGLILWVDGENLGSAVITGKKPVQFVLFIGRAQLFEILHELISFRDFSFSQFQIGLLNYN